MKHQILKEKYHIFSLEIEKKDTQYKTIKEILNFLEEKINAHQVASFISIFDHFSHTKNLPNGEINPEIIDAQNIIFCFGKELPSPLMLAVRPRSIGVAEFAEKFVISFQEAPNEDTTKTIQEWILSI